MDQALAIQDGRARLKMSQEHLASAAGISARTVVRAESGFRVSGESLRNMCAVLGLDSSSIAPVSDGHGIDPGNDGHSEAIPGSMDVHAPEALSAPSDEPVVARSDDAMSKAAPTRWQRFVAIGNMPIRDLPWRRLMALRATPLAAVLTVAWIVPALWAWAPIVDRVTILGETGRWILESPSARAVATYVNALAADRPTARPPALSYFACAQEGAVNAPLRMLEVYDTECGFRRYEILVETQRPPDGTVQTIVGPVGREFGRDLARRLSGDPRVSWKVAFASGRQARGLAWFDPREVAPQDMPRPPDSPSTWVYVVMSKSVMR